MSQSDGQCRNQTSCRNPRHRSPCYAGHPQARKALDGNDADPRCSHLPEPGAGPIDILSTGCPVTFHAGPIPLLNAGHPGQTAIVVTATWITIFIVAAISIRRVVEVPGKGSSACLPHIGARSPIAILAEVTTQSLDIAVRN